MGSVSAPPLIAVAFDVRETSHMSAGMTTYARKLRDWLPRVAPDVQLVPVGQGDNFDLAEQIALPLALARSRPALAHFPTLFVPRFVPVPYVVTIHDLIDLHFPQFVKPKVGPYLRGIVGPVARRARAVLTSDERTRDDLAHFLGVDPARVRLIPLGSDDPVVPAIPTTHRRPYLLYVGNRRPHKDLATLEQTWSSLPPSYELDLVLTGGPEATPLVRRERGEIVFLGDCPPAELRRWYAGAAAYVHPAWREGFGLPLIEAMRNGAPVVATREAVPGVLAAYARLVAAGDVAGFRAAIVDVLENPAAARAAATVAREATRGLTWENTARLTAEVYREVVR